MILSVLVYFDPHNSLFLQICSKLELPRPGREALRLLAAQVISSFFHKAGSTCKVQGKGRWVTSKDWDRRASAKAEAIEPQPGEGPYPAQATAGFSKRAPFSQQMPVTSSIETVLGCRLLVLAREPCLHFPKQALSQFP